MTENRYDKQIALIIFIVARNFKVNVAEIMTKTRQADIVKARHISQYIIEKQNAISLKVIGYYFNRDHSSVIHGRDTVEDLMFRNRLYKREVVGLETVCHNAVRCLESFLSINRVIKIEEHYSNN